MPSVCALVPTFNSARTLEAALRTLGEQDYAGDVETLVVDGGSGDATVAIARAHGARVLTNPWRTEEEARAIGIEATDAELVLLLDADDELPHPGWLARLVAALELAPDVVAADCLYHAVRRSDPPLTRLAGLMGGIDPVAVEVGFGDRWSWHLDRWTAMPHEEEDAGDALLVRIDPDRPPPIGSNGFLVRRDALVRCRLRPFVHSDVAAELSAHGWRFARVRESVVHHHAPSLRDYARKARRRARRSVQGIPGRRIPYRPPLADTLRAAALLPACVHAVRGYRRLPDPAWALYPVVHAIAVTVYGLELLRGLARRREPVSGWMTAPIGAYDGLISVVMPAFDEAPLLEASLEETVESLRLLGCAFEVVVVDDGSSDDTLAAARHAAARLPEVRVIGNGAHRGKGHALRTGVAAARGGLVLFLDADLEVHPRQLALLYGALVEREADVVIGSKLHPDAETEYPLRRRVLSHGYHRLVHVLFRLPVHDTQTGLKLFRKGVLDEVAPLLVERRFAFDLELLVAAQRLGHRIVEAPVVTTRRRDFPRIGAGDVWDVLRDTLAVWARAGRGGRSRARPPRVGAGVPS
ncbi:MAG TPA: glycosyltransferase [Gaiellaceae bacterium]|nr:glycosyltransferase [Gaiellaceae bacterium]